MAFSTSAPFVVASPFAVAPVPISAPTTIPLSTSSKVNMPPPPISNPNSNSASASGARATTRSRTKEDNQNQDASTTSPSYTHTFDAWYAFSLSYAAEQRISGRYGLDFRLSPEPSRSEKRTMKLLETAAQCLGPRVVKRSAVQFDLLENAYARAQKVYPCANPSAHVQPSSSSQKPTDPFQSYLQTRIPPAPPISTSSSATPHASPKHERHHPFHTPPHPPSRPSLNTNSSLQPPPQPQTPVSAHSQTSSSYDPLHETFFNFDLASPSDGSAPPDTDVEHDIAEDTDTDTGSERDLRLEDLEGPAALRGLRRGRGRGRARRRVRAGSTSTTSSGAQGVSPTSPIALRANSGPQKSPFMPANANASAYTKGNQTVSGASEVLRQVYAQKTATPAPTHGYSSSQAGLQPQNQTQNQNQTLPRRQSLSAPTHGLFPSSVSESGAGASPHGYTGVGSSTAVGSINASVAGRANASMHSRGIGAARSEPDVPGVALNVNANNAAGTYSVGPYGYRYPVPPSYPAMSQSQTQPQGYASVTTLSAVKEDVDIPSLVQAHPTLSTDASNQKWQSSAPPMNYAINTETETAMDVDVDMGGWGRVSDPPPGIDLGYGSSNHSSANTSGYNTPYASGQNQNQQNAAGQAQTQKQGMTTYQQQQGYGGPQQYSSSSQTNGLAYGPPTLSTSMSMAYYTSPSPPTLNPTVGGPTSRTMNPNASLNMSSGKWKVGLHGHGQGQGFWRTSDLRSDYRGRG